MIKITMNAMTRKEEIMNEIAILKHENSRIEGAMDVANEVGAIMAVLDLCETLVENEKKIELLEEEISLIGYEEMLDMMAEEQLIIALIERGLI